MQQHELSVESVRTMNDQTKHNGVAMKGGLKPFYQDDYATIYHGDCNVLLSYVDEPDLILTDPPYGVGKAAWDILNVPLLYTIVTEFPDSDILMFGAWGQLDKLLFLAPDRFLFQCKDYVRLRPSPVQRATDLIMCWFRKKRIRYKVRDWYTITTADTSNIQKWHPCYKPIKGILYLLSCFSEPSDLILDPFLGSGTTLVAAKEMGRRSIGIEINEEYCEIAAKRLQGVTVDLFAPPLPKPVQMEMSLE